MGTAEQFGSTAFANVVEPPPGLVAVLEHLGGLARPDVGDVASASTAIFALARLANILLKVPGLGQLLTRFDLDTPPDSVSLIDDALAAFGAERLLWASDFPVVPSREGYGNALNWTRAVVPSSARAAIMGGNAARLLA